MREGTTGPVYGRTMRLVAAIILSLVILGIGTFYLILSFIGMPRTSSSALPIGVFGVIVGLGLLWMIYRARRRKEPARWRFLDH